MEIYSDCGRFMAPSFPGYRALLTRTDGSQARPLSVVPFLPLLSLPEDSITRGLSWHILQRAFCGVQGYHICIRRRVVFFSYKY